MIKPMLYGTIIITVEDFFLSKIAKITSYGEINLYLGTARTDFFIKNEFVIIPNPATEFIFYIEADINTKTVIPRTGYFHIINEEYPKVIKKIETIKTNGFFIKSNGLSYDIKYGWISLSEICVPFFGILIENDGGILHRRFYWCDAGNIDVSVIPINSDTRIFAWNKMKKEKA